ncbi:MAG: ABC transporter substrate-binding protein [Deltaproteobacteria bacterium]|nr:ABC transporter substrate-binding protein [Deltaproteobacteria bacterium]
MSKKITRRSFCSMLLAHPFPAQAQQSKKIPRIGLLYAGSPSTQADRIGAFRQGLRELGYVEGKNIIVEYRYAEGKFDRLPALADELVRLKVDIIVTGGEPATRTAKEATVTIPIVMSQVGDPVGSGFVDSLAHPGGNITGLSTLAPELNGKRLELLKEIIPSLSRVAVFTSSTQTDIAQLLRDVNLAAKAFGVKLQYLDVLIPKDIETAFRAATKERAQAVLFMVAGPIAGAHRTQILDFAVKNRLPMMYTSPAIVEAGGLMTYGVDNRDLDRRAAVYVDKILKGRTPRDLPVEQPMRFEFIVNLKAAKAIGLTIPPNVLVRATKVIR